MTAHYDPRVTIELDDGQTLLLTMGQAKELAHKLSTILPRGQGIMSLVCQRYNVSLSALLSQGKHASIVKARWMAMHLMSRLGMSSNEIAHELHHDHGTVLNGLHRLEEECTINAKLKAEVAMMEQMAEREGM